jgi:hypothetical protein
MPEPDDPDEDETSFIQFESMPPLSRVAIQLHSFGIVDSIQDGHPGFVTDEYLNSIKAETTTTVLELEAAGMWERRDGGYFITADEMVKVAINFSEETDRRQADCAQRGEHRASDPGHESGWEICGHCGIPLRRSDGGPVALPNGGLLGPDPREERP